MKKLLFLFTLSIASQTVAMEHPKPMDLGDETITLVSAQGDEFEERVRAARRAGQIDGLFEIGAVQNNRIKLTLIASDTLRLLLILLTPLDLLLAQNDQADAMKKIYIPRRYQPFVNKTLERASTAQIAALYQAADFLELPFIINALAAVVADRIGNQIPQNWFKLNLVQRKEIVEKIAAAEGIHVKQEYILKHVIFRTYGITQEYSIADYIAQHGQPELLRQEQEGGLNFMGISQKDLTSLFGMELLPDKNEIQWLDLGDNYLFDITLDVQRVEHPFAGLGNLRELSLRGNNLHTLPEGVFAGLGNLQELNLEVNKLHTLPKGVFAGLGNLQKLYLTANQLHTLPEGVFAGLGNLQELNLHYNELQTLPDTVFAGLGNLQKLDLGANPMDMNKAEKQRIRKSLPEVDVKFY